MSAERIARLVAYWVRFYTRDLPSEVAQRRIAEIDVDLRDHLAHQRAAGTSERRIAAEIASRMIRGVAADTAWRRRHAKEAAMKPPFSRSVMRVTLAVALILSLPLVAMLLTDDVVWSLGDFVLAGALLTTIGVALELALRRAGNLPAAIGVTALGVAAGVAGEADDAPGLVLLGLLLVVGGVAIGVRRVQQSR